MTRIGFYRTCVVVLLYGGLPAAGFAACPVASDLATGIEIEFKDGHRSIYTRDADGVLTERELQEDGSSFNFLTNNGVLETGYYELASPDGEPDAWTTYEYEFDLSQILPLKDWSGQSGYQISYGGDGAEIGRTLFGYRTRVGGPVEIGDCTYTGTPLETYYQNGQEGFRSVNFMFLHELTIPVTESFSDNGGTDKWIPMKIFSVGAE